MTKERRHAGRAIRKARRLERERAQLRERQLAWALDIARKCIRAVAEFFAAIGAAAAAAAEHLARLARPSHTDRRRPAAAFPRPTLNHRRPR